jgi:hypothetical protein
MSGSEVWNAGEAYERYVGRWSRPIAAYLWDYADGMGPAPGHVGTLDAERRAALRALLRERLPAAPDGSITLSARAWGVRGTR